MPQTVLGLPNSASAHPQQGRYGVLVNRLDAGDGVQREAFVGSVQSFVADAETGGGFETEHCQLITDVRGPGDLGGDGFVEVGGDGADQRSPH
jgi:hypothetical protein